MNPDSASRLDLNFHGTDRLASLLQQTDPNNRGTNLAALQHYGDLAKRIIDKRSELGMFTNMTQVTGVQGATTGVAKLINERTFIGHFNVLSQGPSGLRLADSFKGKRCWRSSSRRWPWVST